MPPPPPAVLVVDDEPAVLSLAATVLRRDGYEVTTAASGAEALAAARAAGWNVDLLVTDCTMPSMTGAELAEHLRQNIPGLPILFVSGWFEDAELAARIECGEAHYLRKPFTLPELQAKVAEVMRLGR